jgi:hypothetical protein
MLGSAQLLCPGVFCNPSSGFTIGDPPITNDMVLPTSIRTLNPACFSPLMRVRDATLRVICRCHEAHTGSSTADQWCAAQLHHSPTPFVASTSCTVAVQCCCDIPVMQTQRQCRACNADPAPALVRVVQLQLQPQPQLVEQLCLGLTMLMPFTNTRGKRWSLTTRITSPCLPLSLPAITCEAPKDHMPPACSTHIPICPRTRHLLV